jgi:hypothetical protein
VSNSETRQAIADAVSTIVGLKGYARRPNAPKPGDAWPLWRGGERADGHVMLNTWAVVLLLPGDEERADSWVDQHGDDLFDALETHAMSVDRIVPATTPLAGTDAFALMITGRSE